MISMDSTNRIRLLSHFCSQSDCNVIANWNLALFRPFEGFFHVLESITVARCKVKFQPVWFEIDVPPSSDGSGQLSSLKDLSVMGREGHVIPQSVPNCT